MSFLEKKLVERNRFRNLEQNLRVTARRTVMPKSPAMAGRISKKFNPFETAGQTMFSNRSMSVKADAYGSHQHMNQTLQSNPFASINKTPDRRKHL